MKRRSLATWSAVVFLLVLIDLAFLPALFSSAIRAPGDIAAHFPPNWGSKPAPPIANAMLGDWTTQFQRWQRLVRDSWLEGRAPLWVAESGCGAPLAANMQSEAFSPYMPLNLLCGSQYPEWRQFAQMLVAQLSCLWLAAILGIRPLGAAVLAIGFSFTYYMQGWAVHPHSASASFAPLTLAALLRLRLSPSVGRIVATAIPIAAALLAGHIETAFEQTLAAGLIAFLWTPRGAPESGSRLRFALAAAAAGFIAMALSAVLLVPFAEMFSDSTVRRARSGHSKIHLDPVHLATLLDHDALGSALNGQPPYRGERNLLETSFFMGRTLVVFALVGAFVGLRRRAGVVLPLLVVAAMPFVILHGPEGAQEWLSAIPPFDTLLFSRLVYMSVLAVAALAALAVDELLRRGERARIERFAIAAACLAASGLVTWVRDRSTRLETCSIDRWSMIIVGAAFLLAVLLTLRRRIIGIGTAVVVIGLMVFEGFWAWGSFVPTVPVEASRPESPVLAALAERSRGGRALIAGLIPPGIDEPYGIARLRRYDAVESRRLYDMMYTPPIAPFGRDFDILFARPELLDALAIGHVLTPYPATWAPRPMRRHELLAGQRFELDAATGFDLVFQRRTGNVDDGSILIERVGEAPFDYRVGVGDAPPSINVVPDAAVEHFLRIYLFEGSKRAIRVAPQSGSKLIVSLADGASPVDVYELVRGGLGVDLAEKAIFRAWFRITERTTVLPMAYLATRHAVVPCIHRAMEAIRVPGFDPRKWTVVEVGENDRVPIVERTGPIVPAAIERLSPEVFEVDLPDDRGGLLVLAESFAPGWRLRHVGGLSEALPANVGTMAFPVPEGVDHAVIEYRPRSFLIGAIVSLATLLVCVALSIRARLLARRERRRH